MHTFHVISCTLFVLQFGIYIIDSTTKAYNAADFSEINELADDEEASFRSGLKFVPRDSEGSTV